MTKLRRLNERGIAEFRGYLQQIRDGAEFRASPAILYLDDYSTPLPRAIEIEPRPFANKFDAGQSLAQLLADLPAAMTSDPGLWSWLALYTFDQLSPVDTEGRRRPREDYHYIPSDESGWLRDRHLLAGPYKLFTLHNEHSRLLLYPPVHQHGAFVYDLGHRRDLITNRGLIEAMDLLYWDSKRHRPKRGATTTSKAGNLRRLITVIQQVDFNYDLHGMRAEEILRLLPAEFDEWKPPPLLVPK